LLVLGHPECLLSSTDTQLDLKRECRSKTTVWLKIMFCKSLTKHFKGFGSGFTELPQNVMQTRCSILQSIAEKRNMTLDKHLCKNNVDS
jgi:hypothetical protein